MLQSQLKNISMSWAVVACFVAMFRSPLAVTVNETCLGFNGLIELRTVPDDIYEKSYRNCKYVVGNVFMENSVWFREDPRARNFVRNIEVVTGYVKFAASWYTGFSEVFPNLKVIRGDSLLGSGTRDPEYALYISNVGGENFTIKFPELREISNGNVQIFTVYKQCSVETTNWKEIMSGDGANFNYISKYGRATEIYSAHSFSGPSKECSCHPSCGVSGCWGEGKNECQKFSKLHCSSHCEGGRCFGSDSRGCCHFSCLGGCTGPTRRDCVTCKNVEYGGECQDSCPSGMYSFGVNCVNFCPEESLIDEDTKQCLFECPPHKTAKRGKCVKIRSYPRKCSAPFLIKNVWPDLNSTEELIQRFRDCTEYKGSIIIECGWCNIRFLSSNYKEGHVHSEEVLKVFRTLTKVTGSIHLKYVNFTSLSCFQNLKEVGGDLLISSTGIQRIEFPALRYVGGKIEISNNPNLCYVNTLNLSGIANVVQIHGNGDPAKCMQNGHICSHKCFDNGCWGEGPEKCFCLEYKQEGRCVSHCNRSSGYLRDGDNCVRTCAHDMYELNGECLDCHENCRDGCTGPEVTVGENGCNSCYQALSSGAEMICMRDEEDCPLNHFISATEGPSQLSADFICYPEPFSSVTILIAILVDILLIVLIIWYRRRRSTNRYQTADDANETSGVPL